MQRLGSSEAIGLNGLVLIAAARIESVWIDLLDGQPIGNSSQSNISHYGWHLDLWNFSSIDPVQIQPLSLPIERGFIPTFLVHWEERQSNNT